MTVNYSNEQMIRNTLTYYTQMITITGIIFTCSIKEAQGVWLPSYHDSDSIVIKHSGHILRWELVSCVAYEEARFTDGTIAYHHTLDCLHLGK